MLLSQGLGVREEWVTKSMHVCIYHSLKAPDLPLLIASSSNAICFAPNVYILLFEKYNSYKTSAASEESSSVECIVR
jgi:hypothetical protein